MGHIKFMGGLLMAAIFAIAIIGYVTDFGADNDVAIDLSDDEIITEIDASLESDIDTYKLQTNSSLEALYASEISAGDETSRTGGQFKGGVSGAFSAIKNIITIGYKRIFGQEQGNSGKGIVLTALISFLAFVLGMYIWKTWKGNPD